MSSHPRVQRTMEFTSLRAAFDGTPSSITRSAKRPQSAASAKTRAAASASGAAVTDSASAAASARPWVPASRSPSEAHSFHLSAQNIDADGFPMPPGGLSPAEEREQSRRFRIEQAAIRPILTECENKVDAAALRMQALRASLRTDMVVWSSLAEAVASELQRIAPSLSLSLSLSSLSSSSHALPYPTLPASLSDTRPTASNQTPTKLKSAAGSASFASSPPPSSENRMAASQQTVRPSPAQQRERPEHEHTYEPHPQRLPLQPAAVVGDAFVFPTLQQRRLHSRE